MSMRRHTPEQIITALREAEVGLANGKTVGQVSRELGISEQTYYRSPRTRGSMVPPERRWRNVRGCRSGRFLADRIRYFPSSMPPPPRSLHSCVGSRPRQSRTARRRVRESRPCDPTWYVAEPPELVPAPAIRFAIGRGPAGMPQPCTDRCPL